MDSISPPPQVTTVADDANAPMVDPFLVEALQNHRHRLTILRMELDIQKFLRNSDQQQFEFQHFPTSYLRLAAHRVAHHYGLPTMLQDNVVDGQGTRIVVRKSAGSICPAICLSDIPVKQAENDKLVQKKIVTRSRPSKASLNANELGKRNSVITVEERKEEYDRARARIFSSPSSPESEDTVAQVPVDGKNVNLTVGGGDNEGFRHAVMDLERNFIGKDGASSRVAIFRDREKDRADPDYDRSYDRYVRNLPNSQNFNLVPYSVQKFQPPFVQYDSVFPQLGQMPVTQASLGYRNPVMSPYCAIGPNQPAWDNVLMHWPSHAMMYTQSYDQFRHAVVQAPFHQQPLSFDYSQKPLNING